MVKKRGLAAVQSWPTKQSEYHSKILNTIWQLKKQGYAEGTLKAYGSRLRLVAMVKEGLARPCDACGKLYSIIIYYD
jgi:hypothetical protein